MYVWNAIASSIKLVDVCAVHELAVAFSHIYLLYTAKLVSWPNLRRIHELPVVVTTANLQIIVVDVRFVRNRFRGTQCITAANVNKNFVNMKP